jgi:hypothetical protein
VPDFLKEVPADPFDGQTLRYQRLAEGVVVYSVNRDRTDDGGALDRAAAASIKLPADGTDVGVRLWDPSRRRHPPGKP